MQRTHWIICRFSDNIFKLFSTLRSLKKFLILNNCFKTPKEWCTIRYSPLQKRDFYDASHELNFRNLIAFNRKKFKIEDVVILTYSSLSWLQLTWHLLHPELTFILYISEYQKHSTLNKLFEITKLAVKKEKSSMRTQIAKILSDSHWFKIFFRIFQHFIFEFFI